MERFSDIFVKSINNQNNQNKKPIRVFSQYDDVEDEDEGEEEIEPQKPMGYIDHGLSLSTARPSTKNQLIEIGNRIIENNDFDKYGEICTNAFISKNINKIINAANIMYQNENMRNRISEMINEMIRYRDSTGNHGENLFTVFPQYLSFLIPAVEVFLAGSIFVNLLKRRIPFQGNQTIMDEIFDRVGDASVKFISRIEGARYEDGTKLKATSRTFNLLFSFIKTILNGERRSSGPDDKKGLIRWLEERGNDTITAPVDEDEQSREDVQDALSLQMEPERFEEPGTHPETSAFASESMLEQMMTRMPADDLSVLEQELTAESHLNGTEASIQDILIDYIYSVPNTERNPITIAEQTDGLLSKTPMYIELTNEINELRKKLYTTQSGRSQRRHLESVIIDRLRARNVLKRGLLKDIIFASPNKIHERFIPIFRYKTFSLNSKEIPIVDERGVINPILTNTPKENIEEQVFIKDSLLNSLRASMIVPSFIEWLSSEDLPPAVRKRLSEAKGVQYLTEMLNALFKGDVNSITDISSIIGGGTANRKKILAIIQAVQLAYVNKQIEILMAATKSGLQQQGDDRPANKKVVMDMLQDAMMDKLGRVPMTSLIISRSDSIQKDQISDMTIVEFKRIYEDQLNNHHRIIQDLQSKSESSDEDLNLVEHFGAKVERISRMLQNAENYPDDAGVFVNFINSKRESFLVENNGGYYDLYSGEIIGSSDDDLIKRYRYMPRGGMTNDRQNWVKVSLTPRDAFTALMFASTHGEPRLLSMADLSLLQSRGVITSFTPVFTGYSGVGRKGRYLFHHPMPLDPDYSTIRRTRAPEDNPYELVPISDYGGLQQDGELEENDE